MAMTNQNTTERFRNIPCFRITGKNGDADHAWNVVGLDGKRYLSCTTYGQPAAIAFGETLKLIVPNYSFMLASIASIRMLMDFLKVMSSSSFDRKKNISPNVRTSSDLRCSRAIIIYLANTTATCAVRAS